MEDGARRKYENELGNHIYTVLQMLSFTTEYNGENTITDRRHRPYFILMNTGNHLS